MIVEMLDWFERASARFDPRNLGGDGIGWMESDFVPIDRPSMPVFRQARLDKAAHPANNADMSLDRFGPRICIMGPSNSGNSTLAEAIAQERALADFYRSNGLSRGGRAPGAS